MLEFEIKMHVYDRDTGFNLAGYRWVVTELEHQRERFGRHLEKELTFGLERICKEARKMVLNGWVVDDKGECRCIFCGFTTEGFDFGKANAFTKTFNPLKDPCKCFDATK